MKTSIQLEVLYEVSVKALAAGGRIGAVRISDDMLGDAGTGR
jgi:hypothetical protein